MELLTKRAQKGDLTALGRLSEVTAAHPDLSLAMGDLAWQLTTCITLPRIGQAAKMVLTSGAEEQTKANQMPQMAGMADKTSGHAVEEKRPWAADQLETMLKDRAPGEACLLLVDADTQLQDNQVNGNYRDQWATVGAEKDSPASGPKERTRR